MQISSSTPVIAFVIAIALGFPLTLLPQQHLRAAEEPPKVTHDGLHQVINSRAALAYPKPDADLSVYKRVLILDCYVAFKKDWQKDYNRSQVTSKVRDKDIERIKKGMAKLFRQVFVEELTEIDG